MIFELCLDMCTHIEGRLDEASSDYDLLMISEYSNVHFWHKLKH